MIELICMGKIVLERRLETGKIESDDSDSDNGHTVEQNMRKEEEAEQRRLLNESQLDGLRQRSHLARQSTVTFDKLSENMKLNLLGVSAKNWKEWNKIHVDHPSPSEHFFTRSKGTITEV